MNKLNNSENLIKEIKKIKAIYKKAYDAGEPGSDRMTHIIIYKLNNSKKVNIKFDGVYDSCEDVYWSYNDKFHTEFYKLRKCCKKPEDFMVFSINKISLVAEFIMQFHKDSEIIFE